MCGIAGIFDRAGSAVDRGGLEQMRDVMVHRGPDDAGLYTAPGIGLAHRRLSIIDLSPAGHQPMPNEDETVWVVFNGEIYDFAHLRTELESLGHRFRSQSDTEVIVHAYEAWGVEGMLSRLHGMFAIAIWDATRRRLILARDRLGKKPLFYAEIGGQVYFSSDIKSLWLAVGDRLSIDPRGLDDFLFFYCITQDRSIFREVKKVPPAGYLTFDEQGGGGGRYWDLRYDRQETRSREDWLEECEATLRRAVTRRMVADVPLGAFLSGGVDSGLIVALMSQASSTPVKTFSVGMGIAEYDELDHARAVAERYETEHHEFRVDPQVWEMLPELVWQYGEPFGDSSAVPTYLVSKMARQEVTVALSGDGGDEAFAGYPSYAAAHRGERMHWLPGLAKRALGRYGGVLHQRWPEWHLAARLRSFADYMSGDPSRPLNRGMGWNEPWRSSLYSPGLLAELHGEDPARRQLHNVAGGGWATPGDGWRLMMIRALLPSDYLVKVDVASMISSLELRCPFLDTEILELTAKIPLDVLLGPDNTPKSLLREIALRHLPASGVLRRKQGFEVPIAEWLRGPWNKTLRGLLLSERALARGYFQRDMIERTLTLHEQGHDQRHRLWCLLWLELWHLMFQDKVLGRGDQLPLG